MVKFIEIESRRMVARGWGRRNGHSVWEDEKALEMDGDADCPAM